MEASCRIPCSCGSDHRQFALVMSNTVDDSTQNSLKLTWQLASPAGCGASCGPGQPLFCDDGRLARRCPVGVLCVLQAFPAAWVDRVVAGALAASSGTTAALVRDTGVVLLAFTIGPAH